MDIAIKSKKISNNQQLIQSDPISCPQNQKGKNQIHKLTKGMRGALSQTGGHSAT